MKTIQLTVIILCITSCSTMNKKQQNMTEKATIIEMVLFKVNDGIAPEKAKEQFIKLNKIVSSQDGFISRKTAISEDGQYLDLVYWKDLVSAQKASKNVLKNKEATAIFSIINQEQMTFKHLKIFNDYNLKPKHMKKVTFKAFNIIGISVRTTNENQQAATDIGALWNTFMTENILAKIPNKIDNTIYSVYTDYESDYTKPYTTILGCKVKNLDTIPEGMVAISIDGGTYTEFLSKGNLTEGVVFNEWLKIWKMDLNRKYTTDFEVYDERAQNPTDAEVAIYVATNE